MAFLKLSDRREICFYCREEIPFGSLMEFTLPDVEPAHYACNEKANAEEQQKVLPTSE